MTKPILYISGPFSGATEAAILANIARASSVALKAWRAGWACICPHKNTAGFQHAHDVHWSEWIAGDLAILRRCDAILMLPGWERSPGAVVEHKAAIDAGIDVMFYDGSVPRPEEIIR